MNITRLVTVVIVIALFVMGCGREKSFDVAKILFDEITESENPQDSRILANNWEAMEILGGAYRDKGDLPVARAIFEAFFTDRFDLSAAESSAKSFDILIEYASNLLRTTPKNGVLIVYYEETFFLAEFAREVLGVRPDVAIACGKLAPFSKYRGHLSQKYDIRLPQNIPTVKNAKDKGYSIICHRASVWIADSSGRPAFISINAPVEARPARAGITFGTGKLYGVEMDDAGIEAATLKLFGSTLVLDAVSDSTVPHPGLVGGYVQWYSDVPVVTISHWLTGGDIVPADSLLGILLNRLPAHWKPAMLYIRRHPELSEDEKSEYLARIERFVALNPDNRPARNSLNALIEENTTPGEEK